MEEASSFGSTHNLEGLYARLHSDAGAPELDCRHTNTLRKLDEYEELRYPNRLKPIEIGSDDLNAIRQLAKQIYDSIPPALLQKLGDVKLGTKAGRVLMRKVKESG